jgi:nitrate/nitrite transport system ATP-binding protein
MSDVVIKNVSMTFETRNGPSKVLDPIDLHIRDGEFVCLIGHSGCGKSTLLNLIAGLISPTTGEVICGGKTVVAPGPERGMVFQSHSLLPWLTCFENVRLGVENVFGATENKTKIDARVQAAIEMVHLGAAANKFPYEISGGMKQRVGIARALAIEPKVLLLDEPFGALDALTRANLQDELNRIVTKINTTVIMVTHDVDEAILLADRVVMMTNGPRAKIGETIGIDIDKPRERLSLVALPAFARAKQQMLEFLHKKHAHSDV